MKRARQTFLTSDQKADVKRLWKDSQLSRRAIAAKYNIAESTVNNICAGLPRRNYETNNGRRIMSHNDGRDYFAPLLSEREIAALYAGRRYDT